MQKYLIGGLSTYGSRGFEPQGACRCPSRVRVTRLYSQYSMWSLAYIPKLSVITGSSLKYLNILEIIFLC